MKLAEVISIFKKGYRNKITNYCPISLLSQFNELFEKLLYVPIYSCLIKYNLLSDHQYRFRNNYSITISISKIYDELLNNRIKD